MKKYLKKIVAFICVMTLCIGSLHITAGAVDAYSGTLTTVGSERGDQRPAVLYLKGSDEYLKDNTSSWTGLPSEKLVADSADAESGIWLNGIKKNNAFMKKYSGSNNFYLVEGYDGSTTGDVVTIKGTFYSQDGAAAVTYEESSFLWDGTQWTDCYRGQLTIEGAAVTNNTDPTNFYIKGTDGYKTGSDNWAETTMMPAENDAASGVFVDGERVDNYFSAHTENSGCLRIRKINDSGNYYYIERIPNVKTGSVLTIKGTFYVYGAWMETNLFDTTPVVFEESHFLWNGTKWVDCFSGKLTIEDAVVTNNTNPTNFYIQGTDGYKTGSDNWAESTMMPAENDTASGVFVDGERIDNYFTAHDENSGYLRLRKFSDSGNDYYIEKIPNVKTGSVLTIKGTFYVHSVWLEANKFDTTPVVFEESHFQWDGTKWVDYVEAINYPGVLNYTNRDGAATYVYLDTTDTMPTTSWEQRLYALNADSGIYINGIKNADAFMKKVADVAYYVENFGTLNAGDILKIKGLFGYSTNNETVSFDEAQFQWDGTKWKEYVEVQNYPGVLSYTTRDGAATYVYLDTTDTMPTTSWEQRLYALNADSGIYINGIKNADAFMKKVADVAYYVENFGTLNAGDILKIKGLFGYSTNNETVSFDEAQFQWTGSAWKNYVQKTYYTGTLTTVGAEAGDMRPALLYLKGSDEYLKDNTDSWTNLPEEKLVADSADAESGIWLNGIKKENSSMKKYSGSQNWYLAEGYDGSAVGDIVKIKGTFYSQDGLSAVTFEECEFQWTGTKWIDYVEPTNYTGTPVFSTIGNCGDEKGFYFTSADGAPYDTNWNLVYNATDGEANGVFLNGEKTNVFLKKFDTNMWYVCILESGLALTYGDVVTIKGAFCADDANSTVTFTEASFEFNGRHFGEGTFTPIDIAVTGLDYKSIHYNAESNQWNLYFTLNTNMEGNVNDVYFPYMAYEVNGTEYMTHWWKSSASCEVDGVIYYSLFMTIPGDVLPQTIADDTEYTITLKAGASQGRNNSTGTAREDGIRLTEDFAFVVGTDHDASAPAIDYVTAGGGSATGIYLSCADSFPTTGWNAQLKKVGENDGIYKYDASTGTYVATEVFIKKYADNKYYVCLNDVGEDAKEGTIVMLKGTFSFLGLYDVTFKTAKYIYSNGVWQTYTATTDTEVDVEWYGDATGDADKAEDINSQDLVRIKRYLAKEIEEIQSANADLNSSGNIDEHDVALERWLLVNGTTYFANGSNIQGSPTYEDDQEMRLAAYISPDLNGDFQLYKDAGFTTLMGEGDGRAVYGTDGLDAYMKKAESYGLDVLVRSSAIQDMLAGTLDVNATQIESIYNDLSTTYGDTFRGLLLWDEPKYSQLEDHTAVLNTLNSLNAEAGKDMYTAFLPTYWDDETAYWNDTSLSLNEKYSKYANAYGSLFGEFTYDFYPFRYKESGAWFWKTEENYMRSDWFNNLELAAAAGHGKFENGIVVQSYAENNSSADHYRDVTEADISFQVYSALAYGMKSIQYFTYDEHWDTSVGTTNCMIYNGQKTAIYDAVKNVNTEIKKIDHILLNYNWQGTIGISKDDEDNIMDSVAAYTSPRIESYTATNDAIIGCLKDMNGYDGFMLVNATDPAENKAAVTMSVTFKNADHAKVYIDGVESIVELTDCKYSVTLNPGQGVFVIPYIAE